MKRIGALNAATFSQQVFRSNKQVIGVNQRLFCDGHKNACVSYGGLFGSNLL
jgi:hypothetical protein